MGYVQGFDFDEIIKANSTFLDKEWIARDTKIVELIKEMC